MISLRSDLASEPTPTSRGDEPAITAVVALGDEVANAVRRALPAEWELASFDDGLAFLRFSEQSPVDCLICGTGDCETSARMLHERWSERDPWATTVVAADDRWAYDAFQRSPKGAIRFLPQPYEPAEVRRTIEEAQSRGALRRAAFRRARRALELMRRLNARERQVVEALYQGLAHKRIAAKLGVSLRTVEYRRKCAQRKLEVLTLAELVRIVAGAEYADGAYGLS